MMEKGVWVLLNDSYLMLLIGAAATAARTR